MSWRPSRPGSSSCSPSIAEDLPEATKALLTGNNETMQRLTERDKVISALYPEIEQLANREILLQAPVADDLRFLLSVLRVLTEFELSHDLVMQIASRANHFLTDDLSPRTRGIVERMGNLAVRHVAPGRRLLVPARPVRRVRAGRAR